MTIPGVGTITAVTYLTTIDDPDRFQRSRDVGAHLGLTPKKYASGEVDRNSSISKCGDVLMRTTLYQAALALLTRCQKHSALRNWGLQVAKRAGCGALLLLLRENWLSSCTASGPTAPSSAGHGRRL
jgi:transposase